MSVPWHVYCGFVTFHAAIEPVMEAVGGRCTRIRRIFYTFRGVTDTDFGPIELTFEDHSVLLDNAPDGEALRVTVGLGLIRLPNH
jgi:hypothetical protein